MKAEANLNVPTVGRQSFSVEANNEELKTLIVGGLVFGGLYLLYKLIDKEEPPKVYVEICEDDTSIDNQTPRKTIREKLEEASKRRQEELEKELGL